MKWRVLALGVDETAKQALEKLVARKGSDIELAGIARSITTLLFALEESHSELVIIDEYPLGEDPISALTSIHQASPRSRMLIIGDTLDAASSCELLQLGVAGSLRRAEVSDQIWRAIGAVKRGEFWLSRSQSSQLLTQFSVDEVRERGAVENLDVLTPQENRVMRECMAGHSNKEIALALSISEQTVKIHLQHVFQKLGVRRRADLLLRRWAHREKRPEGRRGHR